MTEHADTLPSLQDAAWARSDPEFTITPVPAEPLAQPDVQSVVFVIPAPHEDTPVPNVDLVATNTVTRTDGGVLGQQEQRPRLGHPGGPGVEHHLLGDP